jgi:hypothetical protein
MPERDGQEDAGAVSASGVRRDGSPMANPAERFQGHREDLGGCPAPGVGDEADPARVALSRWSC